MAHSGQRVTSGGWGAAARVVPSASLHPCASEETDMTTFARLTAILLIFFGLLVVIGGGFFISRGFAQSEPMLPGLFGGQTDVGMLLGMRLLVGGALILQGLIILGAGEALWLLTGIARSNAASSQHLATLAARGSMTIP